jgi:hypothetical protein
MMDEGHLMEHIKEQLCLVSGDVAADLRAARRRDSPFRTEYVLPDGLADTWGHVRTEAEVAAAAAAAAAARSGGGPPPPKQAVLAVNNERFMVPEALFRPSGATGGDAESGTGPLAQAQAAAPLWLPAAGAGGSRQPGGLLRRVPPAGPLRVAARPRPLRRHRHGGGGAGRGGGAGGASGAPPPARPPVLQHTAHGWVGGRRQWPPCLCWLASSVASASVCGGFRVLAAAAQPTPSAGGGGAGGTARCPGFRQRLLAELRPLVPDDYEVGGAHACVRGCASEERRHAGSKVPASQPWPRLVPASPPLPPPHSSQLGVYLADDPVLCAWKGAALLAASPEYGQLAVTQQEWRQRGMAACSRWDA